MTHTGPSSEVTVSSLEASRTSAAEPLDYPIRLAVFLLASIIIVFELGLTEEPDWRIRAITWWELIALLNTLVFSFLYFLDLFWQVDRGEFSAKTPLVWLPIVWLFNNAFILAALALRFWCDWSIKEGTDINEVTGLHVWYCICLALSFLMFALIDYTSAKCSKVSRKIREYWILFLFVDSPAAVAFLFVLIYTLLTGVSKARIEWDIISGATVMQMLIADALFLLVASNFQNWYLVTKLPSRDYLRNTHP